MSPDEIRDKGLFPPGFLPLPHVKHKTGGMVFPENHIEEIEKQEARRSGGSMSISTCRII